jgi:hypothetical protein
MNVTNVIVCSIGDKRYTVTLQLLTRMPCLFVIVL